MKIRKLTLFFLVLSLVGFGIGYTLLNSIELGFCALSEPECILTFTEIGKALFYGTIALSLIFLVLLAIPQTFSAWKKFAVWFIPIATILFLVYPEPGSGDLFSPYPEQVFQWVSMLYIGLSLGIIATAAVNQYRTKKGESPLHAFWYWAAALIFGYLAVTNTSAVISLIPF